MGNETAKILDEYRDVFEGVGKLPGKCKIHLKEGVVPTVQPPKRVPFVLQQKLKEELDLLELVGIIEKTSRPQRMGKLNSSSPKAKWICQNMLGHCRS